ncbi:RNA polymerase sigma factor SigJ [Asanoa iriomotensis]|uniref:RNA polymerase sigma24 factor n=1 Tax=Asanoa iriomotensis TaxID=234613 RepID=A0ABQ4CCE4_9ACTN|nr:RNA polymerase sigma factor SigJ [Asanoa iriomotensis]GIF60441.1 RNA polymerase sigma24 factor [Asanoa iriomotensis]
MTDTATQAYTEHRTLLFSIVYNMLGSVADTEDVLQETWLAWAERHTAPGEIDNSKAYLVRIAVNRALAQQASISRRRETYVGPWLPEPVVEAGDGSDASVRVESVSMALLVVLETLTPLERGVFVLHEVFGYAHTEIAEILGRNPSAVRQLAHRAREHVHARRPRFQPDPSVQREVTERFLAAALGGDMAALLEILAPDVSLWGDSGGKAHTAGGRRPIQGRANVARLITHTAPTAGADIEVVYRSVNGDPSALLFAGDRLYAVVVLDLTPDGRQVSAIYSVANPDKLAHVD